MADWAQRLGVPPTEAPDIGQAYLDAVVRHGSGGTGVFGCRIMWESLGGLLNRLASLNQGLHGDAMRIEKAFGPTLYVHLTRADKVAQAISLLKALQSGLWHKNGDGTSREGPNRPQPTTYDATRIARHVDELRRDDECWASWFGENGIAPVTVDYDTLVADPRRPVSEILSALGLDPSPAEKVSPRTARLADGDSRIWAERFRTKGKSARGSIRPTRPAAAISNGQESSVSATCAPVTKPGDS